MPSRSTSLASAPAKALSPALDAEYAAFPGWGACADDDDRNTMRPPGAIAGRAAADTTKADVRLVRSTDSNVSSDSLRTKVPVHHPGGVHEQVDPPRLGDDAGERLGVGAVGCDPPGADRLGRLGQRTLAASGEHDVVARRRRAGGRRRARCRCCRR